MRNEIINMLRKYKVYAPDNRCWFTCVDLLRKMPKSERVKYKFVEGKADGSQHYWIEKDGEIIDVHFFIIDGGVEDSYEYEKVKEYDSEDVVNKINKDSYEEKPGYNIDGKEKWMKVFSVDV